MNQPANDTKSPQESMLTLAFLNFAGIADGVTLSLAMTPERLAGSDAAGATVASRLEEIRRAMQEAADIADCTIALEVTPA
jgi:pyruvate-formate lyase